MKPVRSLCYMFVCLTVHSVQLHSYHFAFFVCLFVVVVVVVSQRCINLFNQFLNNFLSFQLNQDKLRHR